MLSLAVRALLVIPVLCFLVFGSGVWGVWWWGGCLGGRGVFVNWIVDASI